MSWARLDDGDPNGEPCWIRTSDPLLKSAESRQTEYHTLLNLLGFSSHFPLKNKFRIIPFCPATRTKGGQFDGSEKLKTACQGTTSPLKGPGRVIAAG